MSVRVRWLATALLCAVPSVVVAQQRVQSIDDVTRLLASGAPAPRVLSLLRIDCIDFPVDDAAIARLRTFGAPDTFIQQLRDVCYLGAQVQLRSEPAGAEVFIGEREVGATPMTWRTLPTGKLSFRVVGLKGERTVDVRVPAGTRVDVDVVLPMDTVPWPSVRDAEDIVRDLGLQQRYPEIPFDPAEPVAPAKANTVGRFVLGSVLVGGAGFGASMALCNQSVTAGSAGGYLSDGTYVAPGEVASLGPATACQAGAAGGAALLGGFLNTMIGKSSYNGRVKRYEREVAERPAVLADLKARREKRGADLARDPEVQRVVRTERQALDSVKALNFATIRRNDQLPAPTIAMTLLDESKAAAFAAAQPAAPTTAPVSGPAAPAAPVEDVLNDIVHTQIPKLNRVNERAVAVVIGNRNYRKRDIPGVDYAINDARIMKQYLVSAFGFREENILYEEDASYAALQTLFGRPGDERGKLFNYVAQDSTSDIFVFYSGHGAPDPSTAKAYLVPVDADPQLIQLTGYPVSTLYENLAKIPSKSLTVMLDACFSGSSDKGMLLKGVSPALLRVETPILSAPNAVVLSASAANQVSGWYEEKKHGLFSYFVFRGLQGEADKNGDGDIAALELAEYVQDNVVRLSRRLKGREQTPQFVSNAPELILNPSPRGPRAPQE